MKMVVLWLCSSGDDGDHHHHHPHHGDSSRMDAMEKLRDRK